MDDPQEDLLTVEHFARFGAIVHAFARLEYLIQSAMAAISHQDDAKIKVLTKSLSYAQKRDTLYSYFKFYRLGNGRHERALKTLFDGAHAHYSLRTHIAHSLWREGIRPRTIRAGYIDLRQGKGKIGGQDDDDRDYTLDELGNAANELMTIINTLIRYLQDSDLADDIAKNTDVTNRS